MNRALKFGIPILLLLIGHTVSARPTLALNITAIDQISVAGFDPGNGIGGLGSLQIGSMSTGIAGILTSGYIYHLKTDGITAYNQIPIMGGLKMGGAGTPVYVTAEAGAMLTHSDRSGAISDNTDFAWNIGLGTEIGPLDLRVTFNDMSVKNQKDAMSVGLSLGFRIWDNI